MAVMLPKPSYVIVPLLHSVCATAATLNSSAAAAASSRRWIGFLVNVVSSSMQRIADLLNVLRQNRTARLRTGKARIREGAVAEYLSGRVERHEQRRDRSGGDRSRRIGAVGPRRRQRILRRRCGRAKRVDGPPQLADVPGIHERDLLLNRIVRKQRVPGNRVIHRTDC